MTESAVLGAKLLPPAPRPEHLRRPRLHDRLSRCLEARATAVVAGPGYGKSTVVAQFLGELDADSIWYSLDGSDRDPWLFFQYLLHGIRERVPEFGERSAGLWESLRYRDGQIERFVDVFIRDAEESLGARVVLALDRVETLGEGAASLSAIERLLSYLPGTLHVILIGRTLPRLGLVGPKADGSVRTLLADELLFTREETEALLVERFGLAVSKENASRVYERTRGWPMALQLLRQAMSIGDDANLPEDILQRTESDVFEYFAEEVFANESVEVREVLVSLAVPSVIDPEIAVDALPGLAVRASLEHAKERRLFLSRLDGPRELYAFDPLFRDFLLDKLRASLGGPGASRLHRAFGLAFLRQGDHVQALSHLLLAGAHDDLASLLASRGRSLLRAGLLDAVRDAAAFLASREPGAAFLEDLLGEASRLRGDFAAAVGHFESALATPSGAVLGLSGHTRAEALQGLAYSLMRMGAAEPAEATAQRALEAAGDGDPGLVARILNTLSIVKYRGERIDEAISGWQEALVQARRGGDEYLTRMIAHNLGLPHAARGDFRRATECFRILTAPHNPRVGPEEGTAYLNLARIAILRGEHESAARQLDDAWEISRKWNLRALAGDVLEAQGTLLRETGDWIAAEAKYADARAVWIELGQLDLLDSLGEEEAIAAARRGETERAERMAAEILGRARAAGRPDSIASALLALGEIRAGSAEPGSAVAILEEAADIFASLARAYQECAAWLWLGLAKVRLGDEGAAREAVAHALRLSARFDYEALIVRVASPDPAYRSLIRANPSAPKALAAAVTAPRTDAMAPGAFAPGSADLVVRILGPVEVYRDVEAKIPASAWRLKRAFKVFCFLAAARNHRATKDRLAEALWGEVADAVIEKNFHPTISFLRRALNHGHAVPKNFILYEGGVYSFNPEYRFDVDLERFDRGLGAARHASGKGHPDTALKEYDDALALYRGPFLEDEDEQWTAAPRAHYESLLDAALRESAELRIREGAQARAVELLERLVERNPADQAESVRLMRVLGSLGRRAGVEREYRRLQRAIDASRTGGLAFETVRAFREILAKTSD